MGTDRGTRGRRLIAVLAALVVGLAALLAAGLIGAGLALHIAGARGDGKLKQTINAIAAAGAPVKLTQLAKAPVPDAENAALVYEKAFEALRLSWADRQLVQALISCESSLDDSATGARAKDILRQNAQALRLVDRAASMSRCDFRPDWKQGVDLTLVQNRFSDIAVAMSSGLE